LAYIKEHNINSEYMSNYAFKDSTDIFFKSAKWFASYHHVFIHC